MDYSHKTGTGALVVTVPPGKRVKKFYITAGAADSYVTITPFNKAAEEPIKVPAGGFYNDGFTTNPHDLDTVELPGGSTIEFDANAASWVVRWV